MVRKPEQKLWDRWRVRTEAHCFYERVENRVQADAPDLYFACEATRGWVEFKVGVWPKSPGKPLKLPKWTEGQRGWMRQHRKFGGIAWLVVQVGDEILVMRDYKALWAVDYGIQERVRESTTILPLNAGWSDILDALTGR